MKPTLFICIGGSGMKIGHALKNKFSKKDLLSSDGSTGSLKFCFIENDANEIAGAKRTWGDIVDDKEILRIGSINANKIVNEINEKIKDRKSLTQQENDILNWLDPKVYFQDRITDTGLAANRQLGRMAVASAMDIIAARFQELKEDISKVTNPATGGAVHTSEIKIYIISGICGGTGSSMFYDISALIDQMFGGDSLPNKIPILINTNYFLAQKLSSRTTNEKSNEYLNLQTNSWAFINELEFFMKKAFITEEQSLMGLYTARNSRHENRVKEGRPYQPFTNAFLFDTNCSNGGTISLSGFYSTIAEMLYYTITSSSLENFQSETLTNEFVTSKGKNEHFDFSTIALKTIKFPKKEFQEYFESRYIYEIFKDGFLKRDINSESIKSYAKKFTENAFGTEETSVVSNSISDYKAKYSNEILNFEEMLKDDSFVNDKGKLESKENIIEILNKNQAFIMNLKQTLSKCLPEISSFGFDLAYNNKRNVADPLRNLLWEHSQEVIINLGFYGLLGYIDGLNIKGFLDEVHSLLQDEYSKITIFKKSFDEVKLLNDITDAKNVLVTKLSKGVWQKSYADIKDDLNSYKNTLNKYFSELQEYYFSNIKQAILYHFALGDKKDDLKDSFFATPLKTTDLSEYKDSISCGFGTSDNKSTTSNLILSFSKGENESTETIRYKFLRKLPTNWEETQNDYFTVYLPYGLSSYTEATSSRWRAGTVIDDLFQKHVITGTKGLNEIFGKDLNNKTFLLSCLGLDKHSIDEDIRTIKKRIIEKFQQDHINNTNSSIFQFLDQNVQKAFEKSDDKTQEKIINELNNLVYPLRDVTSSRAISPFVNIQNNLENFVTDVLKITDNRIAKSPDYPANQLTLIGIAKDFNYEKITGNKTSKIVFENRDLVKFRPFLHNEWNEYVTGPFEALKNIQISSDDKSSFNIQELFLISLFFEQLIKLSPDVGKLVFINLDRNLKAHNGLRSVPISFDSSSKQVYIHVNGKIIDEDSDSRFCISIDVKNVKGVSLGKLFESGQFMNAFNDMKKLANLYDCLEKFHVVVLEHREDIISNIEKIKETLLDEISAMQESLSKLAGKAKTKKISDDDVEFMNKFYLKTIASVNKLLSANL